MGGLIGGGGASQTTPVQTQPQKQPRKKPGSQATVNRNVNQRRPNLPGFQNTSLLSNAGDLSFPTSRTLIGGA